MIKRIIMTFGFLWFLSGILVPTVLFNFIYPKVDEPDFWVKSIKAMETLHYIQAIWIIGLFIMAGVVFYNFTKVIQK